MTLRRWDNGKKLRAKRHPINPQSIVNYVYDGDQIIAEYTSTSLGAGDGQGNLTKKFIYGPGIDEPIKGLSLQGTVPEWYYHSDGLGSVTEITDSSGAVIEKYAYDVYGKVIIKDANDNVLTQSSIGNTYFFTGRELDSETNLYYYRARYYDPNTGRFLQADPIGYQGGINLYAYCFNNAVNFTDPMGLCGKVDKIRIGFKWIPRSLFFFHTGSQVISSEYGTRSWGFNPVKFSPDVLLGKTVPGKISINENHDFYITISQDQESASRLYRQFEKQEQSPASSYDLYGSDVNNCYNWRNKQFREADISGGSFQ